MTNFLGIPLPVVGVICLGIAALYYVVWPKPKSATPRPSWVQFVLRYSHSLVWVLLALAYFLWAADSKSSIASAVSLLALMMYVVFLVTLLRFRKA